MKLLLDMNIPPKLCEILTEAGWDAIHWSSVDNHAAPDSEKMKYAETNGYVILTHDLDFSTMLAATQGKAPSVLQIRTQDILSERFTETLINALQQFEEALEKGVLVVVELFRSRARIQPLQ